MERTKFILDEKDLWNNVSYIFNLYIKRTWEIRIPTKKFKNAMQETRIESYYNTKSRGLDNDKGCEPDFNYS